MASVDSSKCLAYHSPYCLGNSFVVPEPRAQRRLAAILAADVVGFSRLMGRDEAGTLASLKTRRQEILTPLLKEHQGRLVKVMGDGILVEFASAVDAVQCGLAIQRAFGAANQDISPERHIVLRIGIHVGDVLVEGQDLYGDGVNIAARLEGLAKPGSIIISGEARDQIAGKLSLSMNDLGEKSLKNIERAIRVYEVGTETHSPVDIQQSANTLTAAKDRISIAILPFVNMSGDPESETFGDGLSEDIITALSYSGTLLVISRTSTFAYKGKTGDIKQIGRELDVDYIMEGSIRRAGGKFRVTAQLIETASGHHVWAEKYDATADNIFEVQDQITQGIAGSTNAHLYLSAWQSRRRQAPGSSKALTLAMAAIGRMLDTNKDAYLEGNALAEEAMAADPNLPEAHFARLLAFLNQLAEGLVPRNEEAIRQALNWADTALRMAPNSETAHWIKGWTLAEAGRMEEAIAECELGVSINPNLPMLLGDLGLFYALSGRADEAVKACELAIRVSPRDPAIIWRKYSLAVAQFTLGEYELVRQEMRRIAFSVRGFSRADLLWAASAAALDQMEDARAAISHLLSERPDVRLSNFAPALMLPYVQAAHRENLLSLLWKAGLPD